MNAVSRPRLEDAERRMNQALAVLTRELAALRTGRASPSLLEHVKVSAYGGLTPLHQLATISVAQARMLTLQVWDKALTAAVEKAVQDCGLGLSAARDGALLRVAVPELSGERRLELAKAAGRYAEHAKVAVRNIRRDIMEHVRKMEKEGELSKDEAHRWGNDIQKLTDSRIGVVNETLRKKETEMTGG